MKFKKLFNNLKILIYKIKKHVRVDVSIAVSFMIIVLNALMNHVNRFLLVHARMDTITMDNNARVYIYIYIYFFIYIVIFKHIILK